MAARKEKDVAKDTTEDVKAEEPNLEETAKDINVSDEESPEEEKSITVIRSVVDASLIDIHEDHSFVLQPGHYAVDIDIRVSGTRSQTRILDVTDPKDVKNIEMSTSYKLRGDIHAGEGQRFIIQYHNITRWMPIQSLDPSQYSATLTLK